MTIEAIHIDSSFKKKEVMFSFKQTQEMMISIL